MSTDLTGLAPSRTSEHHEFLTA